MTPIKSVEGSNTSKQRRRVKVVAVAYFASLFTFLAPFSPTHTPVIEMGEKAKAEEIEPRSYARQLAETEYGWKKDQYSCLTKMWGKESAWNSEAVSPTKDYGIPQRHMSHNTPEQIEEFLRNPAEQIRWGLGYIKSRYGTPCEAWEFWQRNNWY